MYLYGLWSNKFHELSSESAQFFLFIITIDNNNLHYNGRNYASDYYGTTDWTLHTTNTQSTSHGYNNNNKGNGKNLLAVINGLFGYFSIDWRHRSPTKHTPVDIDEHEHLLLLLR